VQSAVPHQWSAWELESWSRRSRPSLEGAEKKVHESSGPI